ncbi:MAG: hypothetical protein WBA76_08260 [Phormidesmis sp.]
MTEANAATTELAKDYLGNVSESADVARRVMQAQRENRCLEVLIGQSDRAKGRILTQTAAGQSVGIIKARSWLIKEGDVLSTPRNHLVLVSIEQQQVMALRFENNGVNNRAIALMHLGHMLGNQHWPVTVKGETMYVALVAESAQMESTLRKMAKTLSVEGLHISFETKSPDDAIDFSLGYTH